MVARCGLEMRWKIVRLHDTIIGRVVWFMGVKWPTKFKSLSQNVPRISFSWIFNSNKPCPVLGQISNFSEFRGFLGVRPPPSRIGDIRWALSCPKLRVSCFIQLEIRCRWRWWVTEQQTATPHGPRNGMDRFGHTKARGQDYKGRWRRPGVFSGWKIDPFAFALNCGFVPFACDTIHHGSQGIPPFHSTVRDGSSQVFRRRCLTLRGQQMRIFLLLLQRCCSSPYNTIL